MSFSSDVAVHGSPRRGGSLSRAQPERATEDKRALARLATFTALGVYGVIRWATLMSPAPGAKLFWLLVLAVAVAAVGPRLAARSGALAIVTSVFAFLAMLMISGIPASWLLHARVAVIWQGIGDGLSAVPGVLVPYIGINAWVRLVIVLGAGVLLLDAALMIAFAPRALGDFRRIGAALPLVALAVVPSTIEHPRLPYVQGLILFLLLAAFIWSERTAAQHLAAAVAIAALAGAAGLIVAPGLDLHHPWINYQAIASFSPANVDEFNWQPTYGPLNWPTKGRTVLKVKAAHPDYWKTENLDIFNGFAWSQGAGLVGSELPTPADWAVKRWTQTLQVTISAMRTTDVIAAGTALEPLHVGEGVVPGVSIGTWAAGAPLGPGDSYSVSTYSPRPDPAQLTAVGASQPLADYPPNVFADELTIELPTNALTTGHPPEIEFPAFGSTQTAVNLIGPYNASAAAQVENSPYGGAYRLAQRLAGAATTPYAFAVGVEHYLSTSNGFRYDQDSPVVPYPLETFLFGTKRGYCQQFAGAMALLLRMGGVPARVATGFTSGHYDARSGRYLVSDTDAHAWVEAWFPTYGWVRFDPTPAVAPALGGPPLLGAQSQIHGRVTQKVPRLNASGASSGSVHAPGEGGASAIWILLGALAAVALLAGLAVVLVRRRPAPSGEQLVSELERALERSGRPLAAGTTLVALEHRFHSTPAAEAYVRALRLARFRGRSGLPSAAERRALRAALAAGLGAAGRLRSWWALPPRFLN